jgi:hypothetical protein
LLFGETADESFSKAFIFSGIGNKEIGHNLHRLFENIVQKSKVRVNQEYISRFYSPNG